MSTAFDGARAVVTGGLGFVGSNLARELLDRGADVTVLDARLEGYGANERNLAGVADAVTVETVDVRDAAAVRGSVERADYVFHLAAQLSRPTSMDEPRTDLRINCEGTLNVLEAARGAADPPAVVFASSQAVYGRPESLPVTERTPPNPVDVYGTNKLAGEHYADLYRETHGLDTTVVRLTNVYGPRAQLHNPNYGVVQRFLRLALCDEPLTVFEPGTMQRDLLYVDDAVAGILSACRTGEHDLYLVASGESVSIEGLAERIVSVAGSGRVEMVEWPDEWDGIRVGDLRADPTRLRRDTGWTATTPLRDGLAETVAFYRRHRDAYLPEG